MMVRQARVRLGLVLPVVFTVSATAVAPQTARTPGPLPSADADSRIGAMLQSADPRQQAWGAWDAGREHRRHLAPALMNVVRQRAGGTSRAEQAAVDVALDALIQMQVAVPADLIVVAHRVRPVQALILASQSTAEIDDFLIDVVRDAESYEWLLAANLLVERRVPRFALELLSSLKVTLVVGLYDREGMGGGRGGGRSTGVGCGAGPTPAPGLPPWAMYSLTEFANAGLSVASIGPVPMYYRRTLSRAGETPVPPFHFTPAPTADERLMYLGALAGIRERYLPVRGLENHSIAVRDPANLQAQLDRLRVDVSQRYGQLLASLVAAQMITAETAAGYPLQVDFEIEERRSPQG